MFERYPWSKPPQPGEWAVGCGHAPHELLTRQSPDLRNLWQWLEVAPTMAITTPEGPIETRWIVSCAACFRAAGGDGRRVTIREHWQFPTEAIDHHAVCMALRAEPARLRAYLETLSPQEFGLLDFRTVAMLGPGRIGKA